MVMRFISQELVMLVKFFVLVLLYYIWIYSLVLREPHVILEYFVVRCWTVLMNVFLLPVAELRRYCFFLSFGRVRMKDS